MRKGDDTKVTTIIYPVTKLEELQTSVWGLPDLIVVDPRCYSVHNYGEWAMKCVDDNSDNDAFERGD